MKRRPSQKNTTPASSNGWLSAKAAKIQMA